MNKNILLVEYDNDVRRSIRRELGESYNIIEVTSTSEARETLTKQYGALGLMLIGADPFKENDYALIRKIQNNPALMAIPVLCLGRQGSSFETIEAVRRGAVDYLTPPFEGELFRSRVKSLVRLHDSIGLFTNARGENALGHFEASEGKGTFWNSNSIDSMILHTYAGAACVLEQMGGRVLVLKSNKKFLRELTGKDLPGGEGSDEDILKYLDAACRRGLLQTLEVAASSEEDVSCELRLRDFRKDQPVMHLSMDVRLIAKARERCLFYCTVRNDTEQVEARRREHEITEQLRVIIQNVSGGVSAAYIVDDRISYIYANDQYYSLLGYTKQEFEAELDNGLYDLILPEYVPMIKEAVEGSVSDPARVSILDYQAKKRDGTVIWVRSRSTVCHLSMVELPVFITVLVDITLEKKTEKRIYTINDRLGNSDIYVQLDLTNRRMVEFNSKYHSEDFVRAAKENSEFYETKMLAEVYKTNSETAMRFWSFKGLLEHYAAGDTKLVSEYRRSLPDGQTRWFRATAILMEGIDGGSVNAFIYAQDIDIEKKAELAQRLIVDESIDAIAVINIASGMARTVKIFDESISSVYELYDFEKRTLEFIDSSAAEEDKLRCKNFFTRKNILPLIEKQGHADISYWIVLSDGSSRRMNTHMAYLDTSHEDLVMIGRNITELFEKEQEQQLALQRAVEQANEANRAKSDFLARMSHDFRAPLAAILGLGELAMKEDDPASVKDYLRKISASGEYLLGLINDTLDLSKIESGKIAFNRNPYPIDEFILSINTVMRPLFEAKNIELVIDLDRSVENIIVDKLRFTQIFFNLLSNAAKYTPEGGRVEFTTEPIEGKNGKAGMRFRVRDNGIGMSEEFRRVLFDPFTQENRPGLTERKGSGLGLAIVKRIVDETGGSIRVVSEVGKGSEFIVDLYAYNKANTEPEDIAPKYDPETLRGIHILVVDDTQVNANILAKILEFMDCIVDTAENGLEALKTFESSEPGYYDLIITDLRMPVMDGLEEARRIRALDRPDAGSVLIIAVSADAYSDAEDITAAAGMNARLVKPIQTEELYEMIAELLKKRGD